MENNVLNSLQLYRTKFFEGLVDENMLANTLLTKPHEVSQVLSYIFGRFDHGNIIDFITNGVGKTMTIENRQYEWNVMIEHDKAVRIVSAVIDGAAVASADVAGINQQPIILTLAEKWFGPGAILEFDDKEFQVRVVGEPYQDGQNWVYTVVVADGQAESFIPASLLAAGKQVSRTGSAYEEYSDEADIINYQTPFKLRNHLTTMRLTYDITGDAYSSVMVIAFKDPKTNKSTFYWSAYQEWIAMRQWYERIDRMTMYSKFNADKNGVVSLQGTNGRPVYIGAGLLQQIAPANRRYYTTLTLNILDTFMGDLSYNILGHGERKFIALTGEMGMREFDRVLRAKASSFQLVDSKFVQGSGQNLTLGGQFTTYKGLNGTEITLKHFPLYDNPVFNRKLHPTSGKPLESYRMTFIDYGMRDGESNLRKVVRKDREFVMWHVAGAVAPGVGHSKSITTLRANSKDGYSVNFLSEQGIMLGDPTTSGELICDAE
ncbi:MAG: hypothetical protein ACTSQF_01885 [Candidatus Heimdallarchaeaceae archaeon]